MLESLRNKRILIVVAHPDDELLGLGATMHRLINDCGVKTHVVILGEGLTSRSLTRNSKEWTEQLFWPLVKTKKKSPTEEIQSVKS